MRSNAAEPFTVDVPEAVLVDLRSRLHRWRRTEGFGSDVGDPPWVLGTDSTYLRELLAYWEREYDWRAHERAINAYAHFRTRIVGTPIHFVYEPGRGPAPIPIILTHGWPWTFWDYQKVIGPLSDPAAYGGDPADAFDVVVPSLPGYAFSSPLATAGLNFWRTADIWKTLMADVLGYQRFAAQGGDWGGFVSAQLGHKYPETIIGIHIHQVAWLLEQGEGISPFPREGYAPEEQHFLDRADAFLAGQSGYSHIQATRPQTIGQALDDSPAGLAAWLVEKRRDWADTGGDIESRFNKDDLCTMLTLYWATRTAGSAGRFYAEYARHPWSPSHDRTPVVEAPTGVAIFPEDSLIPSRAWTAGHYNLQRYEVMPRGGHFAPMEEPELLVDELRTFFRALR